MSGTRNWPCCTPPEINSSEKSDQTANPRGTKPTDIQETLILKTVMRTKINDK